MFNLNCYCWFKFSLQHFNNQFSYYPSIVVLQTLACLWPAPQCMLHLFISMLTISIFSHSLFFYLLLCNNIFLKFICCYFFFIDIVVDFVQVLRSYPQLLSVYRSNSPTILRSHYFCCNSPKLLALINIMFSLSVCPLFLWWRQNIVICDSHR